MILIPLSGYLGTGVATEYFSLFDIPAFKDTALFTGLIGQYVSYENFERPIDFFHKEIMGEWVVWLLILGHASAALHHHFAVGDRTLRKLTTGRQVGTRNSRYQPIRRMTGIMAKSGLALAPGIGDRGLGEG